MGAEKAWVVICDNRDCESVAGTGDSTITHDTEAEAKSNAEAESWAEIGGYWLCDNCWEHGDPDEGQDEDTKYPSGDVNWGYGNEGPDLDAGDYPGYGDNPRNDESDEDDEEEAEPEPIQNVCDCSACTEAREAEARRVAEAARPKVYDWGIGTEKAGITQANNEGHARGALNIAGRGIDLWRRETVPGRPLAFNQPPAEGGWERVA